MTFLKRVISALVSFLMLFSASAPHTFGLPQKAGKNTLDMPYCMSVKGDSAYYEFGGITTGYARISKEEYEDIFASQKKAAIE